MFVMIINMSSITQPFASSTVIGKQTCLINTHVLFDCRAHYEHSAVCRAALAALAALARLSQTIDDNDRNNRIIILYR